MRFASVTTFLLISTDYCKEYSRGLQFCGYTSFLDTSILAFSEADIHYIDP